MKTCKYCGEQKPLTGINPVCDDCYASKLKSITKKYELDKPINKTQWKVLLALKLIESEGRKI